LKRKELDKLTIIKFFYPETARKSLEEIDEIFTGKPSAFHSRNNQAKSEKSDEEYVESGREKNESDEQVEMVGQPAHGN
jgi:hypothetical protein